MPADTLTSIFGGLFSQPVFQLRNAAVGPTATNFRVSKVSIRYTSTPFRHMKEDGTTVVDSRIIMPTSVEVSGFCPDLDTQRQIRDVLVDRENNYTIRTKGLIFERMLMNAAEITQNAQVLSAAPTKLSFREVIVEGFNPIVTSHAADSSLIDRGMNILNQAKTQVQDLYSKASSAISSAIGAL